MSEYNHTYGPSCHHARNVSVDEVDKYGVPKLKAQHFYSSSLPIDDPLSVAPTPSGSDTKSTHSLRPFSPRDNNALDEAWLGCCAGKDKKHDRKPKDNLPTKDCTKDGCVDELKTEKKKHDKIPTSNREGESSKKATTYTALREEDKHSRRHARAETRKAEKSARKASSSPKKTSRETKKDSKPEKGTKKMKDRKPYARSHYPESHSDNGKSHRSSPDPPCCSEERDSQSEHRGRVYTTEDSEDDDEPDQHVINDCLEEPNRDEASELHYLSECEGDGSHKKRSGIQEDLDSKEQTTPEYKNHGSFEKHDRSKSHKQFDGHHKTRHSGAHESASDPKDKSSKRPKSTSPSPPSTKKGKRDASLRYSSSDATALTNQSTSAGTTGQPFVKLPSKYDGASDRRGSTYDENEHEDLQLDSQTAEEAEFTRSQPVEVTGCKAHKSQKGHCEIPVGVSRLHMVKIPDLQMYPIYWSPVHDIASVTRGTWFYKDTMYPVESDVANQLELGYRELRPWSQTWKDELNSAMDVGAAGEEKVVHQLWPKDEFLKEPIGKRGGCQVAKNSYCAAKCFHGEASAEGTIVADNNAIDAGTITKKYSSAKVIYINKIRAYILKPTLQPSAYYGRKPIHKILKGINVGICVVRGFEWKAWEKLHPTKKATNTMKAAEHAAVSGDAENTRKSTCSACEAHEKPPLVKDLVLVVHGIGQKLSERVESFNFTHAINSFRRGVNIELANEGVQRVLRDDCGGIMVLPVNWRSNLSFEDGGLAQGNEQQKPATSDFSMKDITPESIPAVRNMISDVMLDIPFYMSHHKPRMIQAVISEANRVYRLWCKNNPEFSCKGRVHIIAHSLGSAMAVDILSKQPTFVPKLDLTSKKLNVKHFDFDCTNLFFAGSPAAFFLLLEKGRLVPRKGRGKVDAQYSDEHDQNITGDAGTYGCMAVDNVYNIMHCNDPIAYRLNPTVDPRYAASLKPAQVPSASLGFFETIGKAVKSMTSGSSSTDLAVGEVAKHAPMARLPSQLELDVHDFTREEIAEKKYYLLNDNGQIDWCLSSGGGPLEIQYINMLSAHSSYWAALDFIRMIVTECGRRPGKRHTLPNMRATKIGHKPGQKS